MCASKGRDLLKGQRGGLGSMGRKVEVKEFELSTKLMNSIVSLYKVVQRECGRR